MAINRLQPSPNGNGKPHTRAANPSAASDNGKTTASAAADAARVGVADLPAAETPTLAASATAKESTAGRDAKGRFAVGNRGGPGNPFARQVAELKKCFLEECTIDRIRTIAKKMLKLAEEGDVAAAKVVLSYAMGKPQESFNPDQIDVDEWQRFEETVPFINALPNMTKVPDAALALNVIRIMRGVTTEKFNDLTLGLVSLPPQDFKKVVDLPEKDRDARLLKEAKKANADFAKYGYVRSIEKACAEAGLPHCDGSRISVAGPSANGKKR